MNILVATDLDEVGQAALQTAVGGAQMVDAKLRVVHAVQDGPERRALLVGMPREEFDAFQQQRLEEAEHALHNQLAETDYRTLSFGVQTHVVEGPAEIVILQAIEKYSTDLLVMGTVGRSGIPGLLVGNTAERLLPEVPCSVLAIKPADFQCPITLE